VKTLRPCVLVLGLVLAGCGGPTGTIKGHLIVAGGPAPGIREPVWGTIYTTGTKATSAPVSKIAGFSVVVPVGTYQLTGSAGPSGQHICRAEHSLVVQEGRPTVGNVYCAIP
jgi:hypothetical protein